MTLEWTGERYLPWMTDGSIHHEHLHRYGMVTRLARNKSVLDIGCGEGYGSAMLANEAARVVAIDVDPQALRHARQTYERRGLTFIAASALALPLIENGNFDLVVCFETLEHVDDPTLLIREARRAMAPGGVLLLSTPNKAVYSDESDGPANPYHRVEFYLDSLAALLSGQFDNVRIWGQHIYPSSEMFPLERDSTGSRQTLTVKRRGTRYEFVPAAERAPRYFIAFASDHAIELPFSASSLQDLSGSLLAEWPDGAPGTSEDPEPLSRAGRADKAERAAPTVEGTWPETAWQEAKIDALQTRLRTIEEKLSATYQSTSAKVSAPIRWGSRWVKPISHKIRSLLRLDMPTFRNPAADDAGICHPEGVSQVSARVSRAGGAVLIMDYDVLHPDRDAGSLRLSHITDVFQQLGYEVVFGVARKHFSTKHAEGMSARSIEVVQLGSRAAARRYLSGTRHDFKVALLSRVAVVTKYVGIVREFFPHALTIFDTVDLHHVRERRQAELAGSRRGLNRADRTRKQELQAIRSCDLTIAVSEEEAKIVADLDPHTKITVLPPIYAPGTSLVPFEQRRDLLFVGSFWHYPNVDGALYFIDEVFPRVRQRVPGVVLHVLGTSPPPELRSRASDQVVILGHVPDVSPWFETCRVFVAPIRFGAGVRGKICHSLSLGLPVVSTPIGAEGLDLEDGRDVLIGDEAESFADATVRLYRDGALWRVLSANGRRIAEKRYSPAICRKILQSLLAEHATRGDFR